MSSLTLSKPFLPQSITQFIHVLTERDRDPFLDELRWRMHLRLLLITFYLGLALVLLRLVTAGRVDTTLVMPAAALGAWAWLRKHATWNRPAVRLVVGMLLFIGLKDVARGNADEFPWALLALMGVPVFGTLLDGWVTGGIAALLSTGVSVYSLRTGNVGHMTLVVAFSAMSAACFFFTSLAHTWIFGTLVHHLRTSQKAVRETTQAAGQLALTLSEKVFQANQTLKSGLEKDLSQLQGANELQKVLAAARAQLPGDLPRSAKNPTELLEDLRESAHEIYLKLGLAVSLATAAILLFRFPYWELSGLVAVVASALLWAGKRRLFSWRPRLRLFIAACLLAMAADIPLSQYSPPTASLVFLPLLVFYVGMLDTPLASALQCGGALLLMTWSSVISTYLEGYSVVIFILGLISVTMLAISHAAVNSYTGLLAHMAVEEEELHRSLRSYRRLVSTLFHDLANPLSVLQTLAALPPALHTPGDLQRAQRMLKRMEMVSGAARDAVNAKTPENTPITVGALADELYDLFRERLNQKQLRWQLIDNTDLPLHNNSSRLRDSVMSNLLSNAIKYSPKAGRITLQAQVEEGWTVLILTDQGPGFPADVLSDIIDGVTPHSRPGTLGETGSGYGLLLASTYAQELGGRLSLRNRDEGGALAELWLPAG